MAYKNLNSNYNPTAQQGISTNLPIEPIQNVDNTKKTLRIFGDYFDNQVTINNSEFDAVKAFFKGKDYTDESADTIAYVICRQSKIDNVSAMKILDQLDDVLINLMFNYFRKKAARDPDQYSGLTQRLYDLSSTYPELVARMNNGAKDPIVEWFMETYSFNAFYNDPEEMATIIVEKLES